MSITQGFPDITTLTDLSHILHLDKQTLFLMSKYPTFYYVSFSIPKKDGGLRHIDAPKYPLRCTQQWILKEILEKIQPHETAMAFRKGQLFGIAENGKKHLNQSYILKIDVKNFFSSIRRKRIYPIFRELGYSPFIANVLTNYCTYNNTLPQGASTSPALSNLVLFEHDRDVHNYCQTKLVVYTRYADDMIFSGDDKQVLLKKIYPLVQESLKRLNLRINGKKTQLLSENNRQLVTGILVNNEKITLKKQTRKRIRAMIHTDIVKKGKSRLSEQTQGHLAYVHGIDPDLYNQYLSYIHTLKEKRPAREEKKPTAKQEIISATQEKPTSPEKPPKTNWFTRMFKKDW